MVRHECAEALGSIANDEVGLFGQFRRRTGANTVLTPQCLPILREYAVDQEPVVRESCQVALDVYEYEHSGAFQYASGIDDIKAAVTTGSD